MGPEQSTPDQGTDPQDKESKRESSRITEKDSSEPELIDGQTIEEAESEIKKADQIKLDRVRAEIGLPGSNQVSEQSAEKSEAQILWDQKAARVEDIKDGLGLGPDDNIKEALIALAVHEVPTSGSCEGHITKKGEEKQGEPFPWIDIEVPEPEGWEDSEKLQEGWKSENQGHRERMTGLLAEFYSNRDTSSDVHLDFQDRGIYGAFRMKSAGADLIDSLPEGEKAQKLKLYQKEMDDFTEFLKEKHFKGSREKAA